MVRAELRRISQSDYIAESSIDVGAYIALTCASCAFDDMTKIRWTEFTESRCEGGQWKVEYVKDSGIRTKSLRSRKEGFSQFDLYDV